MWTIVIIFFIKICISLKNKESQIYFVVSQIILQRCILDSLTTQIFLVICFHSHPNPFPVLPTEGLRSSTVKLAIDQLRKQKHKQWVQIIKITETNKKSPQMARYIAIVSSNRLTKSELILTISLQFPPVSQMILRALNTLDTNDNRRVLKMILHIQYPSRYQTLIFTIDNI